MGSRVTLAWLAHPISLAALVLLLVNDHVLKQLWPGFVTGKLSDVAGMVMFPPLLAALVALTVPRTNPKTLAVVALCATGGGFSMIKLWGYPAQLASSALTVVSGPSLVRADPADLLALPALALAWLAFRRARPITDRTARLVRAVVLLPLALFGTTATSCGIDDAAPPVVGKGPDGSVWLQSPGPRGDFEFRSTSDGGLTFRRGGPEAAPRILEQDCAGDTCYRVVHGQLHVQQRVSGGEWTTAWKPGPGQVRDIVVDRSTCADPQGERFVSQALVVIPQGEAGHVVLVSNGDDGLLRRDPSGTWTRIGPGDGGPAPALSQGVIPGGSTFFAVAIVVLVLVVAGIGVMALKVGAPWRLSRWAVLFVSAALVAVALDQLVLRWGDTAHPVFVAGAAAWSVAALGLGIAVKVRYRRYLRVAWTGTMVVLVCVVAAMNEGLRGEDFLGLLAAALVVLGFILVAITGIGARRHPRQIG